VGQETNQHKKPIDYTFRVVYPMGKQPARPRDAVPPEWKQTPPHRVCTVVSGHLSTPTELYSALVECVFAVDSDYNGDKCVPND